MSRAAWVTDMLSAVSNSGFSANRIIAALGTPQVAGGAGYCDQAEQDADRVGAVGENGPVGKSELTEEERAEVKELSKRDAEVRRHEQAHQAAAGRYALGPPTYQYETGPDGRRYAVEGKVQIDTSEVEGDPEATIRKMQQVQRAANAPAQPSAEDRRVAAKAAAVEQHARSEATRQRAEESADTDTPSATPSRVVDVAAAHNDPAAQASHTSDPASATADRSGSGEAMPPAGDPAAPISRRIPLMPQVAQLNVALGGPQVTPAGRFIDVTV